MPRVSLAEARAPLLRGRSGREQDQHRRDCAPHGVTVIARVSVWAKPLSPVQVKLIEPLSVATTVMPEASSNPLRPRRTIP